MQIMENLHHSGQGKVHRAKSENGKNVRCIYDERLQRNCQDCRDRVDGKQNICRFDYQENNEERCRIESSITHEKFPVHVIRRNRDPTTKNRKCGIFFRAHLRSLFAHKLKSGIYEKLAKHVYHPAESPDQSDAQEDERATHEQSAQDPPEQHLVLVGARYFEITEDHQKDEKIVYT